MTDQYHNSIFNQLKEERKKAFSSLQTERTNWNNSWQLVAEYIWTVKAEFTKQESQGQFLNTELFSTAAMRAVIIRSSVLINYLWNSGAFKLIDDDDDNNDNLEISDFWERVTKIIIKAINKSNFITALDQFERNVASFGTSCLFSSLNEKGELQFNCLDLKDIYIDESEQGKADTLYYNYSLTTNQVVNRFGYDNCCKKIQDNYNKGINEKVKILMACQPVANTKNKAQIGRLFKYESIYLDMDNDTILLQEGYYEQPFFILRESKRTSEKYGRGRGMQAISDILQLNVNKENYVIITNKLSKPSKGVFLENLPGNGIINLSPDSINVFNGSGGVNNKPIFNLEEMTTGNLQVVKEVSAYLEDQIMQIFDLDRLLDLNNDVEMTATEAVARAQIRLKSLGSMFKTRINEFYQPLIKRVFNILLREGKLGYSSDDPILNTLDEKEASIIPDKIRERMDKDEDVYDIKWLTPFAQEEEAVKANSLMQVWANAGAIAQQTQDPAVFDNLDYDETIKLISELASSNSILRSKEEVDIIRSQRQNAQQQQMTMQAAGQMSEIQKNLTQK